MSTPPHPNAASSDALLCPVCQGASRVIGPVFHPEPALVAGVPIDVSGLGAFHLKQCTVCGFQFKDPPIPEERLLDCYRRADAGNWEVDPDPHHRQFDVLRKVLEHATAHVRGRKPRVLDVGCFNGAMLHFFGDSFERFGVEPSINAANLARERGIDVLAATIEGVQGQDGSFDAVMAIDVEEHVNDPVAFFASVARLLRPGTESGVFIGLTGDTGAAPFRLQGSRHWYVSLLPEHVSFYNRSSLEEIGRRTGLRMISDQRMSHQRSSLRVKLRQSLANLVFAALVRTGCLGIPALRRRFCSRMAPFWISSSDHTLHVMRRV